MVTIYIKYIHLFSWQSYLIKNKNFKESEKMEVR